jgi:predicted ATPase
MIGFKPLAAGPLASASLGALVKGNQSNPVDAGNGAIAGGQFSRGRWHWLKKEWAEEAEREQRIEAAKAAAAAAKLAREKAAAKAAREAKREAERQERQRAFEEQQKLAVVHGAHHAIATAEALRAAAHQQALAAEHAIRAHHDHIAADDEATLHLLLHHLAGSHDTGPLSKPNAKAAKAHLKAVLADMLRNWKDDE